MTQQHLFARSGKENRALFFRPVILDKLLSFARLPIPTFAKLRHPYPYKDSSVFLPLQSIASLRFRQGHGSTVLDEGALVLGDDVPFLVIDTSEQAVPCFRPKRRWAHIVRPLQITSVTVGPTFVLLPMEVTPAPKASGLVSSKHISPASAQTSGRLHPDNQQDR